MREKKAFTLVELLGVIVILGIIALITVSIILHLVEESRKQLFLQTTNGILNIVEDDVDLELRFPRTYEIKVGQIINNKSGDLIDFKGKIEGVGNAYINTSEQTAIVYANEKWCVVKEFDEVGAHFSEQCDTINLGAPKIIIENHPRYNPETGIYLQPHNGKYEEIKASAVDFRGNPIELTKEYDREVDPTIFGSEYTLVLEAIDQNTGVSAVVRIVIQVIDETPPVITVKGYTSDFTDTVEAGSVYKIPDAVVTDNSGEVITPVISGIVNPYLIGTYEVTYTATDSAGNTSTLTMTVIVADTMGPTITKVDGNPSNWTNQTVTLKVTAEDLISGIKEYSFDNGATWQISNEKTFSTNQTVIILAKDNKGNISESYSVQISKIDKEPPVITVDGHTSDYTVNVLTTDWITEETLRSLGYVPGGAGVESKIQYGYQNATYAITGVRTDGNAASYAPWYKNVYQYNYVFKRNDAISSFSTRDVGAGAGELWSQNVSGWHITRIVADIDIANANSWDLSTYRQPKVDFKCGSSVIYTMPQSENVQTNGLWTGDYTCNGTISIYSYGYTGGGRNWTGIGGENYIAYYTLSNKNSEWVYSSSDIKDAISINSQVASGYVLPTLSSATGWRDNTPYTASQTVKPVTRTLYKISPKITLPVGSATDNVSENLTVTRTGTVTPSVPGDYRVIYTVTDEAGNSSTLTVTYHVTKS